LGFEPSIKQHSLYSTAESSTIELDWNWKSQTHQIIKQRS
jgi:hypothetical protein